MPRPKETPATRLAGSRSRIRSGAATTSVSAWSLLLSGLVMAAMFVRFFLPAESAVQGDTLWIVALWLVCSFVWLTGVGRGVISGFRPDWTDAAVGLWIGGQVASTFSVLFGAGDQRAAVNMGWEWIGVGFVWLILRHALRERGFQSSLIRATIVTGTVVGGLGLHQHYVSNPQLVAKYGPLFTQIRSGNPAESNVARVKLSEAGIPTEEPALTLYEKRLRDSREPLGLFSLANTLGGCLAACLILAVGRIRAARQRGDAWTRLLPLVVSAGVIGCCLLLTKSRTAWIASVVGIMVLYCSRPRIMFSPILLPRSKDALPTGQGIIAAQFRFSSRNRLVLVGGLGLTISIIALLVLLGGLDQQVISEAPKSLGYRLQYWQATSHLIRDHWWLGVGPGNFRQWYLNYKLPEASEEIADPHNMFFDVAATGGIPSAAGMALFIAFVVAASMGRSRKVASEFAHQPPSAIHSPTAVVRNADADATTRWAFWMAGLGAPTAFASLLVFNGEWEDRLLILFIGWVAMAWWFEAADGQTLGQPDQESEQNSQVAFAAFLALCVHLLGAGGIAMPGFTQWLLAMAAMSMGDGRQVVQLPISRFRTPLILSTAAGLILVMGGLAWTALVPVNNCQWWIRRGDEAATRRRPSRSEAAESYLQAVSADPLSAEPWRRRFELALATENQSNETFEVAVKYLQEAMARDPVNFWGSREAGKLWLSRWRISHNREDANQAVTWLRRARQFYPTNSEILADLAFGLDAAGERNEAIEAARAALAQDEIYHQRGHVDRYLSEKIHSQLHQLVINATL